MFEDLVLDFPSILREIVLPVIGLQILLLVGLFVVLSTDKGPQAFEKVASRVVVSKEEPETIEELETEKGDDDGDEQSGSEQEESESEKTEEESEQEKQPQVRLSRRIAAQKNALEQEESSEEEESLTSKQEEQPQAGGSRRTAARKNTDGKRSTRLYFKSANPNPIDYEDLYDRRIQQYKSSYEDVEDDKNSNRTTRQSKRSTRTSAKKATPAVGLKSPASKPKQKRALTTPIRKTTRKSTAKTTTTTTDHPIANSNSNTKKRKSDDDAVLENEDYEEAYSKRIKEYQNMYDVEETPLRKRRLRNKKELK